MADPRGFLKHGRADASKRPVDERLGDWDEVYAAVSSAERNAEVSTQASRCMDCGIPFCHSGSAGCPLGNLIPEWNDMVRRGQWQQAGERLHATNNFPEFTGRVCPAPCEAACVLAISPEAGGAVTIKRVEETIAENAWERDDVAPQMAEVPSGSRVAVVGSGPGGLAAAQQLTRAGHEVTVYERDDRIGGLLRYGIPEFKLEKSVLDRRLAQMRAEGTRFVTGCEVGVDVLPEQLRERYDAVVLAVGALQGRDDRSIPGRELGGVHLAMEHLVPANKEREGDGPSSLSAEGKHVIILGGGDTGADCYGTATRQGAVSVTQLDNYPEPPSERDDDLSPWPTWPYILRTYAAHEEAGERRFAVAIESFVGDENGDVRAVRLREVQVQRDENGRRQVVPVSDEAEELPCDLALLAIGFEGVEQMPLLEGLGVDRTRRSTIGCGSNWETSAPGVFVCGDAHRGASLVVWAIAEGRSVASAVDEYLTGVSDLPSPVHPTALPLAVV
ncbi:glutamate synthase subunit beta [Saccharopolyspora sp. HNM0983]|uniref:Glutamate synthase subunit beta n=1 Tax=Saccharopolyspora montiporae TaxID=2781240 RepID=A0A929FZX2_9PSEU|nr:glutamate synthase subunit beta [Saccharopolyspora sp. HNM0983]